MLTHRPPNLVAASVYLIGGLLIAACFLMMCFPSSAADVQNSISGNEWGVLVALILVGVLAVSVLSNVLRVAVQLFSQAIQLVVLAVAVWGGVMLYQSQNPPNVSPTPTATDTATPHHNDTETPPKVVPVHRKKESSPGKWWQDNPYEKD